MVTPPLASLIACFIFTPKIALCFQHLLVHGLCSFIYHVYNNYVTYIVTMQLYFSRLWEFRWLLSVAMLS